MSAPTFNDLLGALRFYAAPEHWPAAAVPPGGARNVLLAPEAGGAIDGWRVARAALERVPAEAGRYVGRHRYVVDAFRVASALGEGDNPDWPEWANGARRFGLLLPGDGEGIGCRISWRPGSPMATDAVRIDDWLLRLPDGRVERCPHDHFVHLYEPMLAGETT